MKCSVAAVALFGSMAALQLLAAGDVVGDPLPAKEKAIAKAVHDVFEAAEEGDADRLEALHLYGPEFSKFDDLPPSTRQDAASARVNERTALSRLKTFKATVEDLKVDVLGSVGVATFILRYSFETADTIGSSSARATMVFVETAGSWRIVHEHFSRLGATE